MCVYGPKKCAGNMDRTSFSHIITSEWGYKMPLSVSRSEAYKQIKVFVHNMDSRIHDELPYTIYTTLIAGDVSNSTHKQFPQLELGMIFNRFMDKHNSFVNVNPNTCIHWTWTPKFTTAYEYAIDCLTSRRGHACIVNAPNCSSHFTYITILCADSFRSLLESRKHYKHMKSKSRLDNNMIQEVICDQIQYALKISDNSMYGALS